MLNEISDESSQNFFEKKTHLTLAEIIRVDDLATVILEDCNRNPYVVLRLLKNRAKQALEKGLAICQNYGQNLWQNKRKM